MSAPSTDTSATEFAPEKPPMDPRRAILFGFIVALVTFGGFGTWAAFAPIASAVVAPGVVMVDSNRKKIQHLEGGVVKELLVRDGDMVAAGDVLIRLDETRSRTTLSIIQTQHDTARAIEARLIAERDGVEMISFPSDLAGRSDDAQVVAILRGQENLFDARRNSLAGEISILENRLLQLGENIEGIEAQLSAKKHQASLIGEEIDSWKKLLKKGLAERPRMLALQREEARLAGERGEHVSEISQARIRMGETKLQAIQRQRDLQKEVIEELRAVQTEIADLEERRSAASHVLDHIEIRAPVSGTVVAMQAHTLGGVIRSGETILEIVPADDRLIIETKIKPEDVDNITIGQRANVDFIGFKNRVVPTMAGEVNYLSADRLIDDVSGEPFYWARVVVPDDEVLRLGDRQLQAGMPAQIMIRTGERTALQYLAQPLLDSMKVAWREQ